MSNQESKRAIRFNKNKLATKKTIAKSNTIAIRELFVIIDFRESLNEEHNDFDNNLQAQDQLETNASSTFNNIEINYEILLEKKKEKLKQLVVKYKYQFLLRENQKLQISLQDNEINASFMRQRCASSSKNNTLKNDKLFLKKQRLTFDLKSSYLDNYYKKNFKK